jgi:hypothetical protein
MNLRDLLFIIESADRVNPSEEAPMDNVSKQFDLTKKRQDKVKKPKDIKEDISTEAKEKLLYFGYDITDSVSNGEYEMYLAHNKYADFYQICMQRKGMDFTDSNQLANKQPNDRGQGSIQVFFDKLKQWLSSYHRIYVDSDNPDKARRWVNILKRLGFRVYQGRVEFQGVSQIRNYIAG